MIAFSYRKATREDVTDPIRGPSALLSRFLSAFLILLFVFAMIYVLTKSFVGAGILSGTVFAMSAFSILSHHGDIKRREGRLSETESIEMLEVKASEVSEIQAPGSSGPALCFESPEGQILLLYGQWLLEHSLYRASRPISDHENERFNNLDDPFGFPSTEFILHRWRGEVRPFWIEVRGSYVAPTNSSGVELPKRAKIRDVEIFSGTLASLERDLDSAFGRQHE
jgi:hypothetical protein